MTRLIIDPLTRVEGHGRVELILRNGKLDDVQVRMLESPRLFEKIVVGRKYDEVADLVCRICAICSAVHKLTALEAIERALNVEIPLTASTVRELLLLGGHIQSHALHLFCLVLPDFSGANSVVELLKQEDTLAKAGLELKAFGNHIQEVAGGRVIHPVNPVVGGVAYRPQRQLLAELLAGLEAWQQKWPAIVSEFVTRARFPAANVAAGIPLATASAEAFSLQGQTLWVGRGKNIPAADYRKLLTEESCPESYAKLSCSADGPLLVGALARARLAKERGLAYAPELEQESIYANNHAQLGEIGRGTHGYRLDLELAFQISEDLLGGRGLEKGHSVVENGAGMIGSNDQVAESHILTVDGMHHRFPGAAVERHHVQAQEDELIVQVVSDLLP